MNEKTQGTHTLLRIAGRGVEIPSQGLREGVSFWKVRKLSFCNAKKRLVLERSRVPFSVGPR